MPNLDYSERKIASSRQISPSFLAKKKKMIEQVTSDEYFGPEEKKQITTRIELSNHEEQMNELERHIQQRHFASEQLSKQFHDLIQKLMKESLYGETMSAKEALTTFQFLSHDKKREEIQNTKKYLSKEIEFNKTLDKFKSQRLKKLIADECKRNLTTSRDTIIQKFESAYQELEKIGNSPHLEKLYLLDERKSWLNGILSARSYEEFAQCIRELKSEHDERNEVLSKFMEIPEDIQKKYQTQFYTEPFAARKKLLRTIQDQNQTSNQDQENLRKKMTPDENNSQSLKGDQNNESRKKNNAGIGHDKAKDEVTAIDNNSIIKTIIQSISSLKTIKNIKNVLLALNAIKRDRQRTGGERLKDRVLDQTDRKPLQDRDDEHIDETNMMLLQKEQFYDLNAQKTKKINTLNTQVIEQPEGEKAHQLLRDHEKIKRDSFDRTELIHYELTTKDGEEFPTMQVAEKQFSNSIKKELQKVVSSEVESKRIKGEGKKQRQIKEKFTQKTVSEFQKKLTQPFTYVSHDL